jgi:hypothetical protein
MDDQIYNTDHYLTYSTEFKPLVQGNMLCNQFSVSLKIM